MTVRDEILARVRAALADRPPPPPVPPPSAAGTQERAELVALLSDRLVDYRASVSRVGPDRLAGTVAGLLGEAAVVVVPADAPPDWLTGHHGAIRP
ncbi:MAG: lactate utilization protein C, partial [Micromonosporaceae bacterium]|nr:lactate utilization protein C [Micromonosporaceae bacterium]